MILSILGIIGFVLFVILLLAGLFLVPLGFPGTWLIVVDAFVYSLFDNFQKGRSDFWVMLVIVAVACLGEVLEFGIGVIGSKKLKVSNGAITASIIGGIIGALIGFPAFLVGSFIGLLIGVFLGAFAYEFYASRNWRTAFVSATGAFFSRVSALFVKTALAFVMVVYLLTKTL